MTAQDINKLIEEHKIDTNLISDGYHTFGELYEHRITLWIALCKEMAFREYELAEGCHTRVEYDVWRSQRHSDGELAFGGGWFVLGVGNKPGEQMTYHLSMLYWDECDFAKTLEKAPEWDGHSSADVLKRIMNRL